MDAQQQRVEWWRQRREKLLDDGKGPNGRIDYTDAVGYIAGSGELFDILDSLTPKADERTEDQKAALLARATAAAQSFPDWASLYKKNREAFDRDARVIYAHLRAAGYDIVRASPELPRGEAMSAHDKAIALDLLLAFGGVGLFFFCLYWVLAFYTRNED